MKKNVFIYLTAFFCGMSVMAVELSATRLLAPYFGTSMIVWTVVIGLIMISLSLGNILGGRLADKFNSRDKLYFLIWLAALWIAVIPLIGKYIIALSIILLMWVLPDNLLIAGSVFSCLVVFSFPLVILGMASPYLVKLGVKDMDSNGRTTGEIYALSTAGSIIGTFIPTFLTIPVIGTSRTFYVFALVLNLICLYYFIIGKLNKKNTIMTSVSAMIILALLFMPFGNSYAFWKKVMLEDESLYNYLQVAEDGDSIILSTNVAFGVQSIYKKNHRLSGFYYDYALMAPMFMSKGKYAEKFDVLVLGMGTGTYAKECKYFFPQSSIDGVEIDSKIVALSKKYFGLTDSEASVYVNDGRAFLYAKNASSGNNKFDTNNKLNTNNKISTNNKFNAVKKYDIIMVDAYHDITIPFHMSTKEFYEQVESRLKPGGVIVININMRSRKNTEITDYLTQTVKSVMKRVYKCDINTGTNTVVFASNEDNCLEYYHDNITNPGKDDALAEVSNYVNSHLQEVTETRYVLTDEVAPVEILGQKVLDEIVGDTVREYGSAVKASGSGIRGIFNMLSNE